MKPKQSIAIFNWRSPDDPRAGGAEKVTLEHAVYWRKSGYKVMWFSGAFPGSGQKKKLNGIELVRFGPSAFFFLLAPFMYWVHGGRFAVVVDEIHGIPNFSPLWAGRSKRLAFIHEVAREIWTEMYPRPISTICQWIEHFSLKYIYRRTLFWVDAPSTGTDLQEIGLPSENINVIPCAIVPLAGKARKAKVLTLIVVSRLVPMKGIHFAIRMFAQIVRKQPAAQLLIIGDGNQEYVFTLQKMAVELGLKNNISWLGKVSEQEKYDQMKSAHFLIHTSIREGFGLTVLEAGSQGIPTAAFRVPGLQDLIVNNVSGILAAYADVNGLAKKILALYNDTTSYQGVARKAQQYTCSYTWPKFTKMSLDLIRKI